MIAVVSAGRRRLALALDSLVATAVIIRQAAVAKVDASVTLGNYIDPINRPGGARRIELAGTSLGASFAIRSIAHPEEAHGDSLAIIGMQNTM